MVKILLNTKEHFFPKFNYKNTQNNVNYFLNNYYRYSFLCIINSYFAKMNNKINCIMSKIHILEKKNF